MFKEFTFNLSPDLPDPNDYNAEPPRKNYIRSVVAIGIILVLIGGVVYTALSPFLFPDRFAAAITGVSDVVVDCGQTRHVSPSGRLAPTRGLCVCGQLNSETGDATINYTLRIKDVDGDTIRSQGVKGKRVGSFCRAMRFDETLEAGHYVLEISANARAEAKAWFWFTVVDNRETVWNDFH